MNLIKYKSYHIFVVEINRFWKGKVMPKVGTQHTGRTEAGSPLLLLFLVSLLKPFCLGYSSDDFHMLVVSSPDLTSVILSKQMSSHWLKRSPPTCPLHIWGCDHLNETAFSIGTYIWTLDPKLVELLEKDWEVWPCWRTCIMGWGWRVLRFQNPRCS